MNDSIPTIRSLHGTERVTVNGHPKSWADMIRHFRRRVRPGNYGWAYAISNLARDIRERDRMTPIPHLQVAIAALFIVPAVGAMIWLGVDWLLRDRKDR